MAGKEVDAQLKEGENGLICVLDMEEKAYDHVNWDFLLFVFLKMAFDVMQRKLIKRCISILKYSILVNRWPTGSFLAF